MYIVLASLSSLIIFYINLKKPIRILLLALSNYKNNKFIKS